MHFDSILLCVTLILILDLDMVKMWPHTKNKVSVSIVSRVVAQTDTPIDRKYENITLTAHAGCSLHGKYSVAHRSNNCFSEYRKEGFLLSSSIQLIQLLST